MVFSWLPIEEFTSSWSGKKRKEEDNRQDLISQLSDDILISIIARVGTKEAVRTSILSNRWRNLYKFVPEVDLSYDSISNSFLNKFLARFGGCSHDSNSFINGVNRFLSLRSSLNIRSLKISSCSMYTDPDCFEQFIHSLGRLGIQKLIFKSYCRVVSLGLLFPCHFISHMPLLKILKLVDCTLSPIPTSSKLTQSTSYDSLQVLILDEVYVLAGTLECILANCLSLHSLSFSYCTLPSKIYFSGTNLQLKSLWMTCNKGVKEIEFHASNLDTFEIANQEEVKFRFDHAPKMQSMFVDFEHKNTMFSVCTMLVRDLPHVKSLISFTIGDIYQANSSTMGFNMFSELRKLSLRLYVRRGVNLPSPAPFLERCPLLQEFHLDTEFLKYVYGEEVPSLDVAVIHTELKKVEITGLGGTEPEIQFALCILKSAICLEQMQISRCPKWYEGGGTWRGLDKPAWSKKTVEMINQELQGQAISKKAQLTFLHSPIYVSNMPDIY